VIGAPWWLDDPDPSERTSDWATGQARYAGIMLGYAALALLGLRFFPPVWTTSPADVAASALLSPAWLCGFRAAAALLVLLLVLHLVLGPAKTQSESRLDGSEVFLRIGGCWRLGGLTQLGWILVGCYFALSSWLTYAVWLDPTAPAHQHPSTLSCAASSLLGVAFGFSLLITTVVTFVLVPLDHAAGHSLLGYFRPDELILHNANVALMTLDVLVNSLSVDFGDVAFVVLVGCVYLLWHQFIRYRLTRTLIYPFLSWQSPHAFKIASALVGGLSVYFLLGGLITEYVRPQPWGPPAVLLATCAIMRFRPPAGVTLSEGAPPSPVQRVTPGRGKKEA